MTMQPIHHLLSLLATVYLLLRLFYWRRPELAANYLRCLLLGVAVLAVLTPFAWLLCAVFKDNSVLMPYLFLPPPSQWSTETLNLHNFRQLCQGEETLQGRVYFGRYLLNSLFLACTGTGLSLVLCSLGGYALARFEFAGKRLLLTYMLGTMMFPAMLLLAPLYRLIYHLHWMDSYLALLIPNAVNAFGLILFRQALLGVPGDLIEAARIDGAGEFGIYLRVAMPMIRPLSGAFCLLCFLSHWNAFITPQVYLQTQAKLTLPVVLSQYLNVYSHQYGVFLAGTLLAILPPAILFFALQKDFVNQLTGGRPRA